VEQNDNKIIDLDDVSCIFVTPCETRHTFKCHKLQPTSVTSRISLSAIIVVSDV